MENQINLNDNHQLKHFTIRIINCQKETDFNNLNKIKQKNLQFDSQKKIGLVSIGLVSIPNSVHETYS